MGARLSQNYQKRCGGELFDASPSKARKRRRISSGLWDDNARLIPSLPDEISIQILARLPRVQHFKAKQVSRSWRAALTTEQLYEVRKELGTTEEWLYILTKLSTENLFWHAFDPLNHVWQRLPLMPNIATENGLIRSFSGIRLWHMISSSSIADTLRSWIGRNGSGNALYCGCAIGAVNGCLYIVGGIHWGSATKSVWYYNPIANAWSEAAPMSVGRAYCKIGALNNKLYVVGGVTWDQNGLTPLQSAEMFDPCSGVWTELPSMPFSKAMALPIGFLSNILKPMATGLTPYRGKLYAPQSLYCWPFFIDVGGEVYDPETNSWDEMPVGMGEGWPARQAGAKISAIVNGDWFAMDRSRSVNGARIKVYDDQDDAWETVGDVHIHDVTDSESQYQLAGFLGKLHVVTRDVYHNIMVVQVETQNRDSVPSTSGESDASAPLIIWKVIGTKSAGSTELIGCQILEI